MNLGKIDAYSCTVCGAAKNLMYVQGIMVCTTHDNPLDITECVKLRTQASLESQKSQQNQRPKWKERASATPV